MTIHVHGVYEYVGRLALDLPPRPLAQSEIVRSMTIVAN